MHVTTRFLPPLCFIAGLLTLSGCASSPHNPNEKYVLVATNIKLQYWQSALAGLNKAAGQMDVKTELVGPDTYNAQAQHDAFQSALRNKPAGILVSASDAKVMQPDIDQAISQGVPVIAMDSDASNSKRLLFIGTDNYKAGAMGADVVAKELHGKGNVVIYTMPGQLNLYERQHGYQDGFAAQPGLKVTRVVDIKGDNRIAFDATREIVENGSGKVDAFVCLEAIACPEVADVLDRNHVLHKVVVAMDTDPRTLEWIQKGVITATIGQKPYTMAYYGVRMLDDLHHHPIGSLGTKWGQDPFSPIPAFVDTGATLIDKTNVETFVKRRDSETKS